MQGLLQRIEHEARMRRCEEFSNIHGLGQIRFPKGNIAAKFDDIRAVLEREGLLSPPAKATGISAEPKQPS